MLFKWKIWCSLPSPGLKNQECGPNIGSIKDTKRSVTITLPRDHHKDNVISIIKSQVGFQKCKVDVKLGINNVPSIAYKVVAIGVHQSLTDKEIIEESPMSMSIGPKVKI